MDPVELRPLALGETLDVAVEILRRRFLTLFGLAAIAALPLQVLSVLVTISSLPGRYETRSGFDSIVLGGLFSSVFIGLAMRWLATSVCSQATLATYLGGPSSFGDALRVTLRRIGPLLWLMVLVTVSVGFGWLFCTVPGIWLFVAWSVAIPALLLEDVRGIEAMRRSFRLVRYRWWPTFGALVVAYLLTVVATLTGTVLLQVLYGDVTYDNRISYVVLASLVNYLLFSVTAPFLAAVVTVIYVDLRVRKEGFDIQYAMDRIGRAAAPAPTPAFESALGPATDARPAEPAPPWSGGPDAS
jgi:hypothetical protein